MLKSGSHQVPPFPLLFFCSFLPVYLFPSSSTLFPAVPVPTPPAFLRRPPCNSASMRCQLAPSRSCQAVVPSERVQRDRGGRFIDRTASCLAQTRRNACFSLCVLLPPSSSAPSLKPRRHFLMSSQDPPTSDSTSRAIEAPGPSYAPPASSSYPHPLCHPPLLCSNELRESCPSGRRAPSRSPLGPQLGPQLRHLVLQLVHLLEHLDTRSLHLAGPEVVEVVLRAQEIRPQLGELRLESGLKRAFLRCRLVRDRHGPDRECSERGRQSESQKENLQDRTEKEVGGKTHSLASERESQASIWERNDASSLRFSSRRSAIVLSSSLKCARLERYKGRKRQRAASCD
jgi:hypothetical protein